MAFATDQKALSTDQHGCVLLHYVNALPNMKWLYDRDTIAPYSEAGYTY